MVVFIGKNKETNALLEALEKAMRYEENRPHPDRVWMGAVNTLIGRFQTCSEKQDHKE